MFRRNVKSVTYFPSTNELSKYIEFYDYIYKYCPLAYSYLSQDLKYIFYRLRELNDS